MPRYHVSTIIAAGGVGKRFGDKVKKQFIKLCGKPILYYSLTEFEKCSLVSDIILVLPEDDLEEYEKKINNLGKFNKVSKIISGGKQRQDSVYRGLKKLSNNTDIVVIHDAARPLISSSIINLTIEQAALTGCAICAIKVKDTVKTINVNNRINGTLDRKSLWLAQTPQAFRYNIIKEAYEKAFIDNYFGTDESTLVERIGYKPSIVSGSEYNIKITESKDIELAKIYLKVSNV
jgi:2-C-methyl-D-erythritol 4-phosphate cytidylyltransferase